jgi:hypothetical protein
VKRPLLCPGCRAVVHWANGRFVCACGCSGDENEYDALIEAVR